MIAVANKLIVSAYKLIGFAVLTVLLVGLVSFIGLNAFFFVSRSWVAPTIVSPTDERVLALAGQVALQATAREKLLAERIELVAKRDVADRVIATEQAFQVEFRAAVVAELALRRAQLARFSSLRRQYADRGRDIRRSNEEYSRVAKQRLEQLWAARLVDAEGYVSAGHEVAQLSRSSLNLAEADTSLEARLGELQRDVVALESMQKATSGGPARSAGSLSYEILRMKEEYGRSFAALEQARSDRSVAEQGIASNDKSVAESDRILKGLRASPYLRAADKRLLVAFVPYDNAANVHASQPLFRCRLGMLWCQRVGRVGEVLDGEVTSRHPIYNQTERGQLVHTELEDAGAAESRVLFAGRPPFLL